MNDPATEAASASGATAGAAPSQERNRPLRQAQGNSGLSLEELKEKALAVRRHIVRMTAEAGSGHPGGSLSATDLLTALYFRVMRHDPANPPWPDRDRFILSKGHCVPVLYSVLAETGYFPVEELLTFRKVGSRLQGHCHVMTPGVEQCAGSLGQGLSFGIGAALAGRLDKRDYWVYVMLGDGECDEGQVWEAAMAATHFKLDNLVAIVDRNRIQNDRWTSEAMELEPLADKWTSFGWDVTEIDGHDMAQVVDTLERTRARNDSRKVIIAHTVKGKGVSFMENNADFHGKAPSAEQLKLALKELS
ncbi:MAG: transketolase [Dehalococcoidia bacterium]